MTGYCGLELGSPFFLAPLAGFTDAGFRALALDSGAALVFTEMVSAKGMMYGSPGTDALLYTEDGTAPLTAVQLFGSDPEAMFKAASDPRLAPFRSSKNSSARQKKALGNPSPSRYAQG